MTDSEKIEDLAKQINNLAEKIDAIIKHFKIEIPQKPIGISVVTPSTPEYKDFPPE